MARAIAWGIGIVSGAHAENWARGGSAPFHLIQKGPASRPFYLSPCRTGRLIKSTLGLKFPCVNAFLKRPRKNLAQQSAAVNSMNFMTKKGRTQGRGQSDREEVIIAVPKSRCDAFTMPAIG